MWCRQVWYREKRSTKQAGRYAAAVWLIATTICVPSVLGWNDLANNYVTDKDTGLNQCVLFQTKSYVIYSAGGSFYVPFCVTFFFYVSIFVVLRRRMKGMRQTAAKLATTPGATGGVPRIKCAAASPAAVATTSNAASKCAGQGRPTATIIVSDDCPSSTITTTAMMELNSRSPPLTQRSTSANTEESTCTSRARSSLSSCCSEDDEDSTGHVTKNHSQDNDDDHAAAIASVKKEGSSLAPNYKNLSEFSKHNHSSNGKERDKASSKRYGGSGGAGGWLRKRKQTADHSSTSAATESTCIDNCIAANTSSITILVTEGTSVIGDSSSNAIAMAGIVEHQANSTDLEQRSAAVTFDKHVSTDDTSIAVTTTPTTARTARTAKKKRKNKKETSTPRLTQRQRYEQREMRATIRMAIIILVFFGMWVGFFTIYIVRGCCPDCYIPRELESFFFWLGYSNSSINPILYTIFNDEFRKAFRKILGGGGGSGKRSSKKRRR